MEGLKASKVVKRFALLLNGYLITVSRAALCAVKIKVAFDHDHTAMLQQIFVGCR